MSFYRQFKHYEYIKYADIKTALSAQKIFREPDITTLLFLAISINSGAIYPIIAKPIPPIALIISISSPSLVIHLYPFSPNLIRLKQAREDAIYQSYPSPTSGDACCLSCGWLCCVGTQVSTVI